MATVIGVTADRADEIAGELIVQIQKSGTTLNFIKANGDTIQVANALPKIIDSYPVGSIYTSTNPANPALYMNGGTWQRYGKGRVLVSLDEDDTDFDTVGKTGGAKRVKLTGDETGIPVDNLVRKASAANQYFNTPGSTPASERAELLPKSDAAQAHQNLQPYIAVYVWVRIS